VLKRHESPHRLPDAPNPGDFLPANLRDDARFVYILVEPPGLGTPVFFAFAYFIVALLPVAGLVDHYFL
jgi:hypothetical protein